MMGIISDFHSRIMGLSFNPEEYKYYILLLLLVFNSLENDGQDSYFCSVLLNLGPILSCVETRGGSAMVNEHAFEGAIHWLL